jgi:hypothetical protein
MEALDIGRHLKMKKNNFGLATVSDGNGGPPLNVWYEMRWLVDFNH